MPGLPGTPGGFGLLLLLSGGAPPPGTIHYRLYGDDGAGGPVDYATPLAETPGLSWATPPLACPGDYTFAVRAVDIGTGLEEINTDARLRLVLDASGADITGRPAPPSGLSARAARGGAIVVEWAYDPRRLAAVPQGFRVWLTAGASVDYGAAPAAVVAYAPGVAAYAATVGGLADGQEYAAGVRAYNALATEPNALSATATADATGPLPVSGLAGAATYDGGG